MMTCISKTLKAAPVAMVSIYFSLSSLAVALESTTHILPESISPFFSDSHADISFRNQFKNLNTEDYGERQVQTAWGQGVTLDYSSGYFADIIGVDTSYYSVYKLAASDNFSGRSILYNDKGKAKGFHKFGQLFAKVKLEGKTAI